ncbi:hypothetical protein GUITHDRAFT_162352 [Guillardia theta CCMP2712]|uniref:RING-type domain-containing protein n=1 Tax=Guillardia theta (strain CCMP2712) TaxID=905079 RepID=L1JK87_GUITC|nr:hypothetical protein GUITHDRAFT_162352 [Guillardia theta CCMP2712]EKX48928.1 hypothetical protein GUITHDRAFT_162352 [Guillardia theta CCMP2712]|eukprot:XP_005835908.1 hypothetical protein GUITHDRAFT_162352 [Guillardia theta CCMP2712]
MPVGKFLSEELTRLEQCDVKFADGMIRYSDLKAHLRQLLENHTNDVIERSETYCEAECPVCLDVLGKSTSVTMTSCGHSYHTICLISSLGDGLCTSCPLCRTSLSKLVPTGFDGVCFKLICKIRINVDTAQACHRSVLEDIKRRKRECEKDAEKLWSFQIGRKKGILKTMSSLLRCIEALERFSKATATGICKISSKIAKTLDPELGARLKEEYVTRMLYYQDCAEDGNKTTANLKAEIIEYMENFSAGRHIRSNSSSSTGFRCLIPQIDDMQYVAETEVN